LDTRLRSKYSEIANQCRLAILNYDLEKEKKILETNNLGAFFKFTNKKLSSPSGISPLLNVDGILLTADPDKAKLLSEYFASVYTTDDHTTPPFKSRLPSETIGINDVPISIKNVTKIISKLKSNSAAGPDLLPPIFFRNTAAAIGFPLSILFRSFLDLRNLPDEWRQAIITPKFKKGIPSDVSNYRPIALTCTACKILESLISTTLLDYLDQHNLISKQQHGFLKKHSTTTNILSSLNDWTLSMHNHRSVVIAYIDFQRAFDAISHTKLIFKLSHYGIDGNLLFWIQAFLTNRSQCVKVNATMSSYLPISSGVPQGSVIGPLLFTLFINDIIDLFDSPTKAILFADDIKIYSEIKLPPDAIQFQNYLDAVHSWSSTWQIGISYSKCNLIVIGNLANCPKYTLSSHDILNTDTVKDLGVYVDHKLNFKTHIEDCIVRAKQRSALIFRGFLSRNIHHLTLAFISYIRPLLEYASPVWSPSFIYLNDAIESVQRSYTKRLPGFDKLTYTERLQKLKLQSLEHRRLICDLVLCYNIIHGYSALQISDFFKLSNSSRTRGHNFRLEIPLTKCTPRHNFVASRVIKPWNSLPHHVVNAPSTHSFKSQLASCDLSIFLKFPIVNLNY